MAALLDRPLSIAARRGLEPGFVEVTAEKIERGTAFLPGIVPPERTIRPFKEPFEAFDLSCHRGPIELGPVGTPVDDGYVAMDAGKDRMEIAGELGKLSGCEVVIRGSTEERGQIFLQLRPQRPKVQFQFGGPVERRNGGVVLGEVDGRQKRAKPALPKPAHGIDLGQPARRLEDRSGQDGGGLQLVVSHGDEFSGHFRLMGRWIQGRKAFFEPYQAFQHVGALRSAALGVSKHRKPASEICAEGIADGAKIAGSPKPFPERRRIRDFQRVRRLRVDRLAFELEFREPTQGLGKLLGRSAIGIERFKYGKGIILEFGRKPVSRERSAIFLNRGDIGWVQIRQKGTKRGSIDRLRLVRLDRQEFAEQRPIGQSGPIFDRMQRRLLTIKLRFQRVDTRRQIVRDRASTPVTRLRAGCAASRPGSGSSRRWPRDRASRP